MTSSESTGNRRNLGRDAIVLIAALFVVGLAVVFFTGDRSQGGDDGGADPVAQSPTGGHGEAGSDEGRSAEGTTIGVTADTVRIGVMLMGLGDLAALGAELGIDPDAQRSAWTALIEDANEAGGLHGRRIEPVFEEFDVTDETLTSMREACVAMAEDHEVFAVIASIFFGDPVRCVTERYETPLLHPEGDGEEFFEAAGGRLITLTPSKSRGLRNLLAMVHDEGLLDGATIGVLGASAPRDIPTLDAVGPALSDLGHDLAVDVRITTDGSKAAAEVDVGVQKMKREGVDTVIASWFPDGWLATAEAQGFRPRYLVWDMADQAADVTERGDANVAQQDGMIAVTSTTSGDAEGEMTAAEEHCAAVLDDSGYDVTDRRALSYVHATGLCDIVEVLAEGLRAAGPALDREGFVAAISGLTDLDLVRQPAGSGFPEGRTDHGTLFRMLRWDADCLCFEPMGEFVPAEH